MKKIYLCLLIVSVLISGTGCGLMQASAGIAMAENPKNIMPDNNEIITKEDDSAARKIITEYFTVLYTGVSVDEYNDYSSTGVIPGNIRGYIAGRTIKEGEQNPEIGIHLPRYISINGMTIIGYDVEIISEEDGGEKANIESGFISKNENNYLYFVKVYCKAKAVTDEVFSNSYRKREDNTYSKLREINPEDVDFMRVEIRYDVELEKSDSGFSILRAIESNIKAGMKNRLFVFNNDSITRLPYLNLTKKADGSYLNRVDGETYESEKAVITEFFSQLTRLDRERMNLLSYRWKQGANEVSEYLDNLGITTAGGGNELIVIDNKYDENYPFSSLPLRNNMEIIKEISNFEVIPHPAYSEKLKLYFVNFDAAVQRTNGITDEYFNYRYDYIVSLAKTDDLLFIQKIRLNEYYTLNNK